MHCGRDYRVKGPVPARGCLESGAMTNPFKVAVMGAGAVGCYFGGLLARAGHDVTLIARPEHVEAIRRDGLRMETRTFDERVRLAASADPAAVRGADLVLFCVKSTATEAAGAQLRPFLGPDALVLCLQNGVDNAERLRTVLPPQQVAAAVVYVATEMAGPGHVKHHGRGELVIEPSVRSAVVVQALADAGVPTEVSANVRGALWAKLIINCAYNAVSAIAQRPYGENVASVGIPRGDGRRGRRVPFGRPGRGRAASRRHARSRAPPGRDHADPVVVDGAGPGPRQAHRDRPPERAGGAPRRRARDSHARQPGAVGIGEAAGASARLIRAWGKGGPAAGSSARLQIDYSEELLARLEALRRSATITPA